MKFDVNARDRNINFLEIRTLRLILYEEIWSEWGYLEEFEND